MTKPSVLFAYGASGGSGGEHADGIARHMGVEPYVLRWRQQSKMFNVPPQMQGYMGDRFKGFATDEADPRDEAAALGVGEWAWSHLRPEWRRSAIRGVYGSIAGSWTTIADALNYLHNGLHHVRAATPVIEEWAATAPPPRVAIGLSLGGLILADTLAEMGRDGKKVPIELLVTVGSQVGIINLADAMAVLRQEDGAGPKPFVPWLNIWNRDDYLSWPLEVSLPDHPRIRDRTVEAPEFSFPEAHSAYFQLDETYQHINAALPH